MTRITYQGPHDAVVLPDGTVVARGETVEVDAELAGATPDGDEPGSGLLAQVGSWHQAGHSPRLDAGDPGGDATIEELLAYVAGDPGRAGAVRDREQARGDERRKTLIATLDDITGQEA